jgi:tetratricopeptide (TPR) repeat protein
VLIHLKRPKDGLASYDRALTLDPNHVDVLINRSAALEGLGRPQEALGDVERALAARPDDPGAWNNKGTILKSLGRIDEACDAYQKSLAIAPNDAEARTNYAMALFLKGDLSGGWREYEVRWQKKANIGKHPPISFSAWMAEPLEGRRIVVFAEQGLGDIVQFSRYLPLLQQRGASVTFLVTGRMHAVLRTAFPGVTLSSEVK